MQQTQTPTLAQFLAGQPLAFKSLAGHDRVATFHTDDVPWMEFAYPGGKVIMRPIMSRDEAERFYIDATAASQAAAA